MSTNRFQAPTFSHNMAVEDNRLHKIELLVSHFNLNYEQLLQPGTVIAIDESMILFRGILKFKQYIPEETA